MMVQANYKLTEKEIYLSLIEISKSRFITLLMRGVGFVILAFMLFYTTASIRNGTFSFSLGHAFPIFLSIYLIFLSEITARFQTPSLIKNKNAYSEEVKVKIYETGFSAKGLTFFNQFTWDKIVVIMETDLFFILKETEVSATVIPKRALKQGEIIELKAIFNGVEGPKIKLF